MAFSVGPLAFGALEQLLLFGDHFLDSATEAGVVHAPTIAPIEPRGLLSGREGYRPA